MSGANDGGDLLLFPLGEGDDSERDQARELEAALEAMLFASGEPVKARKLADALEDVGEAEVVRVLETLRRRVASSGRGLDLVEVAGGWQLRTDPRFAVPILRLIGGRAARLSRAALEVLAVIAYRQPVTRSEVENLRGVDSGGVLKTLLDRGLLRVAGRRSDPGRPLEYGTTPGFLEVFGLIGLDALPSLEEREELERYRDE